MRRITNTKKKKKRKIFLLLLLLSTLLLYACDNSEKFKNLKEYIQNIKQSMATKKNKTTLADLSLPTVATYKAQAIRAPFEDTQSITKGASANPLQAYPISMLRFLGTVVSNKEIFAFIQTPDDKIYQLKTGDQIGNHYGKIISVSTTRLEVEEKTIEQGKPVQRIVTLEIKG